MKKMQAGRIAALFLCLVLLLNLFPMTAFAADESSSNGVQSEQQLPDGEAAGENTAAASEESQENSVNSNTWVGGGDAYNSVALRRDHAIAPGVEEQTLYLNDASGNNQNVCHVMEVDLSNPNVDLLSGYSDMNPEVWKTQVTSEQAKAAERVLGVNVVGAINTNLSWESDEPIGMLVINGTVYHQGSSQAYFVLTKDGKAEIRGGGEPLRGNEWQATSTFQILVQNGVNLYSTPDHATGSRAPRTAIGIKADGNVVLFVVDGRQAPYSVGMTGYELAQTMIDLGCVTAVNCDGGGTSTFVTERAGTGELKIQNSPSDGVERPTLGTLMVVSKAKPTGVFDHAVLSPSSDLYTPGSTIQFSAVGADSSGAAVSMPENVTWRLSESSAQLGSIDAATGLFTGGGSASGTLTVELVYENEVVGSTSVQLVHPDSVSFPSDEMSLGFSETCKLGLTAKYGNVSVSYAPSDFRWSQSDESMGVFNADGTYTTNDSLSINGTITATYVANPAITATMSMVIGKLPTIVWDFEDVTTVDETTGETVVIPAEEYYSIDKKDENGNQIGLLTTSNYGNGGVQSAEIVSIDDDEPVRMGTHSLKLNYDFRNCGAVTEGALVGTTQEFKIPGSPSAIGVWVYAPEGTGIKWGGQGTTSGLWLRGYYKDSTGSTKQYEFTFEPKNFGDDPSDWPDEYPGVWWEGWKYCEAKLNGQAPYSILPGMTFRLMFVHGIKMGERTAGSIYFDNFQFVYGTNVDDTDAPYANAILANFGGQQLDLTDGTVIPSNTMGFSIDYMDVDNKYTSGVDASTTRMYIDGVNVIDDDYYNTYTDNDGRNYVYGLTLKNGWHTLTAYAKDKAGNEFKETRRFLVQGDADLSAIPNVTVSCAEESAMLGGKMNLSLQVSDPAAVTSYSLGLKVDKNFPDYTISFAEGYEGTYRYNKLTKVIQIEATKVSEAAGSTVATVSVAIPTTLKSWDTFSYSVEYCQYVTADRAKYTYSQAAQEFTVDCMYTVSAEPILVGESGVITISSKGASLANVGIYREDGTLIGLTDENGTLTTDFLSSAAADAVVYAKDSEGRLSFTSTVSSFNAQGDESCAPFGIMNHASKVSGLEGNVTWFTNPKAPAQTLQYKVSGGSEWTTVNAVSTRITFTKGGNSMVSVHSAEITGLSANTVYVYRVGDGEQWSKEYTLKTDDRDGTVKFFVLGDIQTEDLTQVTNIVSKLNAGDFDFGIQTGDAVDDATSYAYWMGIVDLIGADALGDTDVIHVLGNHEFAGDATADRSTKIYNLPTSGYGGHYSVVYDNVYVAVINYTTNRQELAAALEWLKEDAAKTNAAWKILTIHQPAYFTNTSGGNNEIHDMLPAAAEAAGIDFVFSGHDHSYARTLPMTNGAVDNEKGVVYFIAGSTGEKSYSVTDNPDFNFARLIDNYTAVYLTVEANETSITVRCLESSGEELDSYTKEKKFCEEHEYVLVDENTIGCRNCSFTTPFATFSGMFFDESSQTYKYAVAGKILTGYQRITGQSYYFESDGSAYEGEYVIGGETCLFERGTYVSCSTASLLDAGWCGENVEYVVYEDGLLRLAGNGPTSNYDNHGNRPFINQLRKINRVEVGKGITVLGHNIFAYLIATEVTFEEGSSVYNISTAAFLSMPRLQKITLPDSVTSIGAIAFKNCTSLMKVKIPRSVRSIADTAFKGCPADLTLFVKEGSAAQRFAEAHGLRYTYEDIVKNGFYEENGELYYYENDAKWTRRGLFMVGNDYYYAKNGGGLLRNVTCWASITNDLLPKDIYTFGPDGKVVLQNGFIEEGDELYYYVNGVKWTRRGLFMVGNDYYYAKNGGGLLRNVTCWASITNGLLPKDIYTFGPDGKVILRNGFFEEGDELYYYVNGVKWTQRGLFMVGEDYYYAKNGGGLLRNVTCWASITNGLLPKAIYTFGPDGKIVW